MDGKGITWALRVLAIVFILGIITLIGTALGWNKTPEVSQNQQPTSTPTPSPTAVTLNTSGDIDALQQEMDNNVASIDSIQKELDSIDTTLSTTEPDTLTNQLNNLK